MPIGLAQDRPEGLGQRERVSCVAKFRQGYIFDQRKLLGYRPRKGRINRTDNGRDFLVTQIASPWACLQPPLPPQDLVKASQAMSKLALELEGSQASEARARREASGSKADLAAALAREEGAVSRLREVEGTAARREGELEGRLAAAEEACREGAGAAAAAAREEEVVRGRAKLAEVVARRGEKVRGDGEEVRQEFLCVGCCCCRWSCCWGGHS